MTRAITSADPLAQAVLDCIHRRANGELEMALDRWLEHKGEEGRLWDPFFLAACFKQGAGVMRTLVSKGMQCSTQPLRTAIARQAFPVVNAMLPAMQGHLAPPLVSSYAAPTREQELLCTIIQGPLPLAQKLLTNYAHPRDVAPAVFQQLLMCQWHGDLEFGEVLPWLIGAGANPNALPASRHVPLHYALQHGKVGMAIALIEHGADLSVLDAPSEAVMSAVFRSRIVHETGAIPPAISPLGWRLLELASSRNIPLPVVVRQPWPHVDRFDRHTGKLYGEDADRLEALSHRAQLDVTTPVALSARSARF